MSGPRVLEGPGVRRRPAAGDAQPSQVSVQIIRLGLYALRYAQGVPPCVAVCGGARPGLRVTSPQEVLCASRPRLRDGSPAAIFDRYSRLPAARPGPRRAAPRKTSGASARGPRLCVPSANATPRRRCLPPDGPSSKCPGRISLAGGHDAACQSTPRLGARTTLGDRAKQKKEHVVVEDRPAVVRPADPHSRE